MNGISIYQHPFVDVFKTFKIAEWKESVKEGDVRCQFDKQLAKNIFKVSGSTLASNYIQLPSKALKSLGLTGKWVSRSHIQFYIQMRVNQGKQFSFHLDYKVDDNFICRVSCSNQFVDPKVVNSTNLQIPLKLAFSKWNTIALSISTLIQKFFGACNSLVLRSIQICANCEVKGIYTSDIQYRPATLPKEMQLRLRKDQDWFSLYEWIQLPQSDILQPTESEAEMMKTQKKSYKAGLPRRAASAFLKKTKNKENTQPNRKEYRHYNVQEVKKSPEPVFSKEPSPMKKEEQKTTRSPRGSSSPRRMPSPQIIRSPQKKEEEKKALGVLKPNPIMSIHAVMGGIQNCMQAKYMPCARLNDYFLYASGNMLVTMSTVTSQCRFFYYKRSFSKNFAITQDGKHIVAQCGQNELTLWEYGSTHLICSFIPPAFLSIYALSVDIDGKQLLVAGKDNSKRDLLMIFNLEQMIREKTCAQLSRQLSDFNIRSIRFTPETNSRSLVSVGKENIRFWKIKASGNISGNSVTLNSAGRDQIFSAFDFEIGKDASAVPGSRDKAAINALRIKNVLAVTLSGKLFVVSYSNKALDKVVQIHNAAVHSIQIAFDKSFVLTATQDGILRLWRGNLEFSNSRGSIVFEEKLDTAIISTSIAPLNNGVVALLKSGAIIHLDVESKRIKYKMRSHSQEILDFVVSQNSLVSISRDRTIRIWDVLLPPYNQKYEFVSPGDLPLCLSMHPNGLYFAAGFESGYLRVFGVDDYKQHVESLAYEEVPILLCDYSPDARYLAILKSNGRIVIYDIKEREYEPIKSIEHQVPHPQYYTLKFSTDGRILATLSYNANSILLYESLNFTQKAQIDLVGHMARDIFFSPNQIELAVLTYSNQIKYYRQAGVTLDLAGQFSPLSVQRGEVYASTALSLDKKACETMAISKKSNYISVGCEDGTVRIYDYALRATGSEAPPEVQIYMAHMAGIKKVVFGKNKLFSMPLARGGHNAIFMWGFYGGGESDLDPFGEAAIDKGKPLIGKEPPQLLKHYPEDDEHDLAMPPPPVPMPKVRNPFDHPPPTLAISTAQPTRTNPSSTFERHVTFPSQTQQPSAQQMQGVPEKLEAHAGPIMSSFPVPAQSTRIGSFTKTRLNGQLSHTLSFTPRKNNLIWIEATEHECGKFVYSSKNTVIVEELNDQKTQTFFCQTLDTIHGIVCHNGKLIVAHTYKAQLEGFANAFLWDLETKKLKTTYCASSRLIRSVDISPCGNLLLMLSSDSEKETLISMWAVYSGELLTKSLMTVELTEARFNPYINSHQFIVMGPTQFNFWRISQSSQLEYQKFEPDEQQSAILETERFTTFTFTEVLKCIDSVVLLLGLTNGSVQAYNTRTNSFVISVSISNSPILALDYHDDIICVGCLHEGSLRFWRTPSDLRFDNMNLFRDPEPRYVTIDGNPVALSLKRGQGFVGTSGGSVWFINESQKATVPIVSSHTTQITHFDQRYLTPVNPGFVSRTEPNSILASASSDGIIKVWDLEQYQQRNQFCVPEHMCSALALHPYNSYLVAGFTDGYLRFFDISDLGKNLGRCLFSGTGGPDDHPIALRFLPSGNECYCASRMGIVSLLFIDKWCPLSIRIHPLLHSNAPLLALQISFQEPYNKWMIGTRNGKIMLYNRQNANILNQQVFKPGEDVVFNFLDSFNIVEYLANGFAESRITNKLDYHFRANLASAINHTKEAHEVSCAFSPLETQIYVAGMKGTRYLFVRNFQIHQTLRRIELQFSPFSLQFYPNSTLVFAARPDGIIDCLDYNLAEEQIQAVRNGEALALRIQTSELSCSKVANGMMVTGTREGIIQIIELNKQI